MAKKARTPKPPRPVQAPRRRGDDRRGGGIAGSRRWLLAGGAVVVAGIVAAVAVGLSGGGGSDPAGLESAMAAAGCTVRDVPPVPPKDGVNFHNDVPTLQTTPKWSTDPPSAGAHYAAWAVWGFYREPVPPQQVVHNLEHGGIAIWWGPEVPAATVDRLEAFYRESPVGMIGTPYDSLGEKIALTAWTGNQATYTRNGDFGVGHIAVCERFDEDAFTAFRDAFRGKGPEGIPLSANQPGSGPQ